MENMAQFLHKLLNESIRVNQLINVYNMDIVDYVINGDSEWSNFYDMKFKNNVDFTLVPNKESKDAAWSFKYVDKFIIDFRNKFDWIFVNFFIFFWLSIIFFYSSCSYIIKFYILKLEPKKKINKQV